MRTTIAIAALAVALVGSAGLSGAAAAPPAAQTKDTRSALTPDAALALLKAGNERFAAGRPLERDELQQVRLTSGGQFPYGAILGCIDSRVPPEIVFDTGIGDVFAARIAGNVLDDELNAQLTAKAMTERSPILRGLVEQGKLRIVPAVYDVSTGHVTFLG